MTNYSVNVPSTMNQGSFQYRCNDNYGETYQENALYTYNSARAHDCQAPLKRMPNGTTYTRISEEV